MYVAQMDSVMSSASNRSNISGSKVRNYEDKIDDVYFLFSI